MDKFYECVNKLQFTCFSSSFIFRVPLLPRQPPSEPAEEKGVKKKGGATPFSPPPPAEDFNSLELDQQLIVHAYNTAIATVFNLVSENQ